MQLSPYLDYVLNQLNLTVENNKEATKGYIKYYIDCIINNDDIEDSLYQLNKLQLQLSNKYHYDDEFE